ncbi:MAG: 4Fe-4S dicluster domain-containing protein [Planctomycetota bacterium]|nr:4Fe-4S dicluster domain-containing protein [Planctomycetota bacterium]
MSSRTAPSYGFVIDNRRCIGCHACTVACKTEHSDPVGVNKTWVQYLEKGVHPHAERAFHVLRCNHCTNAPCVDMCPTSSLTIREDAIVDFDPSRCIGCKACMQACPYDAIDIHPDTGTATKCNFCAHRVDAGREPACVVVCPTDAIITGDLSDPDSRIASLVAGEPTMVRKPEKGTGPKIHYIEGHREALDPLASRRSVRTLWGQRPVDATDFAPGQEDPIQRGAPHRTYDIHQRHAVSWGWKVSAYLWTKSIAAGAVMVPALLAPFERTSLIDASLSLGWSLALIFLAITGVLLVTDLKRPERFLWVMLRPQWSSWLVRGAYGITFYGLVATLGWWRQDPSDTLAGVILLTLGAVLATFVAVYTGWLFGQAKGRDLWQSALSPVHLGIQAIVAGAAILILLKPDELSDLRGLLAVALIFELPFILLEVFGKHSTEAAAIAARSMTIGSRGKWFYVGAIGAGRILPILLIIGTSASELSHGFTALLALAGIAIWEHLWVEAPQRLPLA